jgi:hypothetical protein
MTDTGAKLYVSVKSVRAYFTEIARMLKDCDRLANERGWEAVGSGSISGGSNSIHNPERWIPYAVSRIYTKTGVAHITKVIAVILDDPFKNRVSEPIVVGSSYTTKDEYFVSFSDWDHTWWWLEFTDAVPNGKPKDLDQAGRGDGNFARFSDLKLLGYPLSRITSCEEIREHVIEPLMEHQSHP